MIDGRMRLRDGMLRGIHTLSLTYTRVPVEADEEWGVYE
jgi:hypothetical protein